MQCILRLFHSVELKLTEQSLFAIGDSIHHFYLAKVIALRVHVQAIEATL